MDLDFWHCFGRKNLCLITEGITYHTQDSNMDGVYMVVEIQRHHFEKI